MSKEVLTHSDRYVRKTNRIILIVGIITLFVFLFGLMLLTTETPEEEQHYEVEDTIDAESDLGMNVNTNNEAEIEFDDAETIERPITLTPNPINMGQVVLGNDATNVLTIGTNSKAAIKIVSVDLEEVAFEGFTFDTNCNGKELRGKITCTVTMKWSPTIAANVQNNFKITWHETNVSDKNAKHDEVPVYGNAIHKEDCNFCEGSVGSGTNLNQNDLESSGHVRYAVGPDGKVIGVIGDDGIVRDANGNEIGRVNADGLIVDKDGNIIGVASTGKLVLDENGNVIGYVDGSNVAHDVNGKVLGNMLADGTIIDNEGYIKGRAVSSGYVMDANGNIIGKVLEDGTVVDLDGNVIGRVNENGEVVDKNGNIIGRVAKSGEVALDENGNPLGVVMPNGDVVNENGDTVGHIDAEGNVYQQQKIGQKGAAARLVYDANGNIIGYVDENGIAYDFNGNVIGHVDENGNVIDANGNIIGHVGEWRDLAYDENGNVIGYVDENGIVHNGKDIIGYIDENGNIVGDKDGTNLYDRPIIGKKGNVVRLAFDKDGNIIGYIDENGNVRDFNGNIIGRVDEDGNILDNEGNIIGRAGENANLALDKNGTIIGYVKNNIAYDKNGKIMGIVDANGNIRVFGMIKVGSLLDKMLLPITPDGKVLGEINNRGEIVSQNKVIGKMRPDGLATDKSGGKILARGLHSGYIASWGCRYEYKLDKDGVVRKEGNDTDFRVYADGTVWSPDGKFVGKIIKTGSVYDDECNYIGEVNADGSVRDAYNKEVGCVNPDGTVLGLDKPQIKGHLVEPRTVMSLDWQNMGTLDENGTLRQNGIDVIGCVNGHGEVFDKDMSYIGSVSNAYYAYDLTGKFLGTFDKKGNLPAIGKDGAHLFLKNLIADKNNQIIGFAAPEINILIDAKGNILGHLFPDGNVYNSEGEVVDQISGDGTSVYNGQPAKFLKTGYVVDMDGQLIGYISFDMDVVKVDGSVVGHVDANGRMFDENGRQLGGVVVQGGVRGYNGSYMGYVVASGDVVELMSDGNNQDLDGNEYHLGDVTGRVVPDGHVVKDGRLLGEILPETAMIDIFGNYVGYSDAYGIVNGAENQIITALLPGGVTNNNISALPKGIVIDFGGKVIGTVLPDGRFFDLQRSASGTVMADGKVISNDGKLLGEVVNGDIVIGNDDKVAGMVGFDGKIYQNGNVVGHLLTDGFAVDNQNNVIGHVYSIGNTILSNDGDYIGRLAANGKVIESRNKEIGYMKSNGSFIDADKNVSGYLLPEVAKNRRN